MEQQLTAERRQIQKKQELYDSLLFLTLSYGILVTWFAGVWLPGFQQGCIMFGLQLVQGLQVIWNLLRLVPDGLAAMIPESGAGMRPLVWLAAAGAELYGSNWAAWKGLKKLGMFCRWHLMNRKTAVVLLAVCAVCVFFAGPIQTATGLSCVWWMLMALSGYAVVVWFRSR